MLVARREPMLHSGAQDPGWPPRHERAPGMVPRAARFMTVVQVAGSLVALPAGLATAYSIYRANFSVETTCQNLRTDIVSLIDKKIDAATRRILVRRDVEAFEKTCSGVDPDAGRAFKALLAADKAPAVTPPPPTAAREIVRDTKAAREAAARDEKTAPAKQMPAREAKDAAVKDGHAKNGPVKEPQTKDVKDTAPKEAARKSASHPAHSDKPSAAAAEGADVTTSDANWLEAVRGALVSHPETGAAPPAAPAPEAVAAGPRPPAPPPTFRAPPMTPPPQPAALPEPTVAPVLPPATTVPAAPAPEAADPNHPVPPAPIPAGATPQEADPAPPAQHSGSGWISNIPVLGKVFE